MKKWIRCDTPSIRGMAASPRTETRCVHDESSVLLAINRAAVVAPAFKKPQVGYLRCKSTSRDD